MRRACVFCGDEATQRHHVTARLHADGDYLDATFTVDVCRWCHAMDHRLQRAAGLDRVTEALRARLLRTAWLCGRVGDLGRILVAPPTTLHAIEHVLLDAADALDPEHVG